jgi:hypothetical protein
VVRKASVGAMLSMMSSTTWRVVRVRGKMHFQPEIRYSRTKMTLSGEVRRQQENMADMNLHRSKITFISWSPDDAAQYVSVTYIPTLIISAQSINPNFHVP